MTEKCTFPHSLFDRWYYGFHLTRVFDSGGIETVKSSRAQTVHITCCCIFQEYLTENAVLCCSAHREKFYMKLPMSLYVSLQTGNVWNMCIKNFG